MDHIQEIERKEISKQAQKIIKSVNRQSSAEVKADAALALSVLALLSQEIEPSISQQFLKFVRDLRK